MRFVLGSTHSMHPLARWALLVLGGALFCLFAVLGAMLLAVVLGVGLVAMLVRRWRQRATAPAPTRDPHDPHVLEGTYVVLDKSPR
ncbi:MAG: hypothetical protein L0H70_01770 [Xanthomonadales bacterium]|nr:hypothetical protein [Xanthomonadales bacterium]